MGGLTILYWCILLPIIFVIIVGLVVISNSDIDNYTTPNKNQTHYKSKYDKLLHDDRWYNKRRKILDRDNHKCQWCGKTTNLQVHHKYYNIYPNGAKVKPWDYPDDALMVLCDDCHEKYHKKYTVKTYYRKKNKHFKLF